MTCQLQLNTAELYTSNKGKAAGVKNAINNAQRSVGN